MKTSPQGQKLIKEYEGLRLESYPDQGGLFTIGYGTTIYPNGQKVKQGDKCIAEQAEGYFQHDLSHKEAYVNSILKVELKQNQYDAFMSFIYNCGSSAQLTLLINRKTDVNIISQWWCTHYITAGGKIREGLKMRREKEAKLFCM